MMFWKALHWKEELPRLSNDNNAVMQILNLRMIYVFLGIAVICFFFQEALLSESLGRVLLIGISLFWLGRTIEHFLFARLMDMRSPVEWILTSSFIAGIFLPILPMIS